MLRNSAVIWVGLCLLAGCNSRQEPAKPAASDQAASQTASSEASDDMSASAGESSGSQSSSAVASAVGRLGQNGGLWQLTQSLPQTDGSSKLKICISPQQGATLAQTGQDFLGKPEMLHLDCSVHTVRKQDDGADIDTVCAVNNTTLTSTVHVDIIGHSAYHQTAETRYSPAFAGRGDLVTITDGKWLGDCPAGMAPGDLINHDGVKMKVGTILARFAS